MTNRETRFPSTARRAICAAFLLTGMLPAAPVHSQASGDGYPNKPIRLMVGYSAGGGVDAAARLLSSRLSTMLGQQVVVENRAGAAGLIAAETVARAPADGYTLLLGESALLATKVLQPKMPLDPLTQFTPVAGAFVSPLVIVTGNDFPARTPAELVALLKANPGKYSFASSGVGTVQHLGFEMFKQATNSFAVHIPYRGAAQIVPDVVSGQVDMGVVSVTAAMAQQKAGRLRALALMSSARIEGAAGVAPLSQAVSGFGVAPRLFLLAPRGTPANIVEKLAAAVRQTLEIPEVGAAASAQGTVRAFLPPAELARELVSETARWQKIVTDQKITVEGN